MLTETQKTQFFEVLDLSCAESVVVATRDTVEMLISRLGAPHHTDKTQHGDVLIWNIFQTRQVAGRGDLYMMDFGDVRAVYFCGEA